MRATSAIPVLSLLLLSTACSDGTGPTGSGTAALSLSLATSATPAGSAASNAAGTETFTLVVVQLKQDFSLAGESYTFF